MEYFTSLIIEVISEVIGLLLVSVYLLYQKRKNDRKMSALKDELDLEKLNNSKSDEVLLIHNIDYLSSDDGMDAFNQASIVLLKDKTGLYNTVIKNDYGGSGIIRSD